MVLGKILYTNTIDFKNICSVIFSFLLDEIKFDHLPNEFSRVAANSFDQEFYPFKCIVSDSIMQDPIVSHIEK